MVHTAEQWLFNHQSLGFFFDGGWSETIATSSPFHLNQLPAVAQLEGETETQRLPGVEVKSQLNLRSFTLSAGTSRDLGTLRSMCWQGSIGNNPSPRGPSRCITFSARPPKPRNSSRRAFPTAVKSKTDSVKLRSTVPMPGASVTVNSLDQVLRRGGSGLLQE